MRKSKIIDGIQFDCGQIKKMGWAKFKENYTGKLSSTPIDLAYNLITGRSVKKKKRR